jgi:hypothetical protein
MALQEVQEYLRSIEDASKQFKFTPSEGSPPPPELHTYVAQVIALLQTSGSTNH